MRYRVISWFCLIYGLLCCYLPHTEAQATRNYWQQTISYKMEVRLDVHTDRFTGEQTIKYKNNSPETLDKVYFHLYLNAFQPGSAMDIQSNTLPDADPRIGTDIGKLQPNEIGYQHILKLTQDGKPLKFEVAGTILEVTLSRPIRPGQSTKFFMVYEAQVPLQIRRSGRDNDEGIRYSMAQWYPKLCEYDTRGWHADPYLAREFYGVWGDFDVQLTLDAGYMVAASGELVNASKIGHGYSYVSPPDQDELTWHFVARNVHDFVWAADPDYRHDMHTCANGVVLHAFYQPQESFVSQWEALLPIMEEALNYMNANFGKYPYPVYSFIQGGDGGMEYPMATLITGHRSLGSLVGVSVHEMMHSWYQMVLGFNESYYYWMDEGFANYGAQRVMEHLKAKGLLTGPPDPMPFKSFYSGYANLVQGGIQEPLSTHADHFNLHTAYSISAYNKGALFFNQMEYVIGKPAFDQGLLDFYNSWKFKHPDDNDFIRIMEHASGLELDWYKDYMVYSTKTIDYSVDTVFDDGSGSTVYLSRRDYMPMPVDVVISLTNGTKQYFTIPLDIMLGAKYEQGAGGVPYQVLPDWEWVNLIYQFHIPYNTDQVSSVMIDPSMRMADLNRDNNLWPPPKS